MTLPNTYTWTLEFFDVILEGKENKTKTRKEKEKKGEERRRATTLTKWRREEKKGNKIKNTQEQEEKRTRGRKQENGHFWFNFIFKSLLSESKEADFWNCIFKICCLLKGVERREVWKYKWTWPVVCQWPCLSLYFR